MRLSSTGKGPNEYIAAARAILDISSFSRAVRAFVSEQQLAIKLDDPQIQTMYEISVDHHRRVTAIEEIQRTKLIQDWNRRKILIANANAKLAAFSSSLRRAANDKKWPATAEFADAFLTQLNKFQRKLNREIEDTETRQRAQAAMIRALPLKTMRDTYVGELYLYATRTFPGLTKRDQQVLIAAAMYAAREFTPKEVAKDTLARMPMMVSRAKRRLDREILEV